VLPARLILAVLSLFISGSRHYPLDIFIEIMAWWIYKNRFNDLSSRLRLW